MQFNIKNLDMVIFVNKLRGGVSYRKEDTSTEMEEDRENSEWTSKKTVYSVKEREEGMSLWGRINRNVRGTCLETPIGLMCPKDKRGKLEETIEKLQQEVSDFNLRSLYVRIDYKVLFFSIVGNEEDVALAIRDEITELVSNLLKAVDTGDPKEIREAVAKAKGASDILAGTEAVALEKAVKTAREVARKVTKQVVKQGQRLEEVLGSIDTSAIDTARFEFLSEKKEPQITGRMDSVDLSRFDFGDTDGEKAGSSEQPVQMAEA